MRRYLLLPVILLTSGAVSCARQQTITVNWSSTRQTIDGFGAAGAGVVQTLTSAQMNFFYTSSGIGLQWYRMQIYPDLTDCQTDQGNSSERKRKLRHCVFWTDNCQFRPFHGSSRSGEGSEGVRK